MRNGAWQAHSIPKLFPDTQFLDKIPVSLDIFFLEVGKESPSFPHFTQQSLSAGLVLFIGEQVLCQYLDLAGEDGYLSLDGTRIVLGATVFLENLFFYFCCDLYTHFFKFTKINYENLL